MTFEELQRQEIERLNNALVSQSLQPEDRKLLNQKMFNPKTGELQLLVANLRLKRFVMLNAMLQRSVGALPQTPHWLAL